MRSCGTIRTWKGPIFRQSTPTLRSLGGSANRVEGLFPGSVHVFATGLARFTTDESIWEYAGANGFTIVTADSDFLGLAESRGAPPPSCPPRKLQLQNTPG
ncbi:MAG: DUF5615 family PIN-like protein [Bryobacteraceae bacterium]